MNFDQGNSILGELPLRGLKPKLPRPKGKIKSGFHMFGLSVLVLVIFSPVAFCLEIGS